MMTKWEHSRKDCILSHIPFNYSHNHYLNKSSWLITLLFSRSVTLEPYRGFSDGSDGKESASNAGASVLLPGSGRSPGEGDDYPLLPREFHEQRTSVSYSLWGHKESDMAEWLTLCRASLVPQLVKNIPAMQETRVWSLGQEVFLEKEMVTHSSILAWRIPWIEEPSGLQSMGSQRVEHNLVTKPTELYSVSSHIRNPYNNLSFFSQPYMSALVNVRSNTCVWFIVSYPSSHSDLNINSTETRMLDKMIT